MKKLFFYAAAALAMLASCQKTEVIKTPSTPVDDSQPVAMQLNVNAPAFQVTKTKAAVDEWNNTPVYIYGLQRGEKGVVAADADKYDFTDILIDAYKATVVDENTPLEIYQNPTEQDAAKRAPYFYAEGETYDFFGYHLGNLTAGAITAADDEISFPVTITGQDDLMVAAADKANDIKNDNSTDGVNESDIYSAWAARRNVHPTLVFKHALTRFNFIVRGMNDKAEKLQITGISMPKLKTAGTLTVVGDALGFEATGDVVEAGLSLPAPTTNAPADVVKGNTTAYSDCLMIEPGLEEVEVKVTMQHETYDPALVKLEPYSFKVHASQVLKEGVAAEITEFAAGTAYNIYVNVYGPEEIIIKVELTDWLNGGDYTYDPDQERPGQQATAVKAVRTVTPEKVHFDIEYTSDIYDLQAAIATDTPAEADWTTLVKTKAVTGIEKALSGEDPYSYKLYIRYKAGETDKYSDAAVADVREAEAVTNLALHLVSDKASYDAYMPAAYVETYPWKAEYTKVPWLVATFDATTVAQTMDVMVIADGKAVEFTDKVAAWPGAEVDGTHLTLDLAEGKSCIAFELDTELGLEPYGVSEYTIKINDNIEASYAPVIKDAYYVIATEESYNQLPEAYRTKYGQWGTNGLAESLPWLAIETTPGVEATFDFTRGEDNRRITWTVGEIGLCTFDRSVEELNVASLVGEWTVAVTVEGKTETAVLVVE